MNIMNMSKYDLKKIKKFSLARGLINTEAELFILKVKNDWNIEYKMLKVFYNNSGSNFSNKLFTINELIDKKEIINMNELVIPEKILIINDEVKGFSMPYIKSVSFETVLNDFKIDNLNKIEYFKQISNILKKMDQLRKNSELSDFYLNDIHENNFIVNNETDKINVVDLDSCKIGGNEPFASKYLTMYAPISNMNSKYKLNNDINFSSCVIPDKNTDLYCYTMMIINFLFKGKANLMNRDKYYLYLDYLRSIGYSYNLLDKFYKIYEYVDNELIDEELNELNNDMIYKSHNKIFEMKIKK